MNELEIKKKNFKNILKGRYAFNKNTDIKQAKEKLRQTDPGIDISDILQIISNEKKDNILKNLMIEFFTNPDVFVYYMPVIKSILRLL